MFELKGRNGQIELYDDYIVVKRKGFFAKVSYGWTKGEKTIYFHNISAVQVKKPGMAVGYIQFTLGGGNESTKGIMAAVKDENTITFDGKEKYEMACQIRDKIAQSKTNLNQNKQSYSVAEEILKYKKLLDDGLITPTEYEDLKRKIIL